MIMKRLHICLFGILAILSSCAKTADVPLNEQKRQYLEDWIKRYPDAKKENGCYILEDIPGDGAEYDASGSGYVFVNTIVRRLDGTVLSNSDEQMAMQLLGKDFSEADYYGPRALAIGEGSSYAGFDMMLGGMKEGGRRTAVIPSWLMTFSRFGSSEEYFANESDNDPGLYTIIYHGQCKDISQWEKEQIKEYADKNLPGAIGSSPKDAEFDLDQFLFLSRSAGENITMPIDTTVYINYTGRLLNGQVFDTTVAEIAAENKIYDKSKTYAPVPVKWGSLYTDLSMSGSTNLIKGFQAALYLMHPHEKASVVFTSTYGYSSSGSGTRIPGYAPLHFDIEIVDKL